MSPLRTKAFHQRGNFQHLVSICLIGLEGRNLLGDLLVPAKPLGRVDQRPSDRFGTIHPRRLKTRESSFGGGIEAERYRSCHRWIVSPYVIHRYEAAR